MAVDLATLKNSLRIDDDDTDDDQLLTGYITAAQAFIRNAIGDPGDTVPSFYDDDRVKDLFDTATLALASGYYTARSSLSLVALTPVDLATNSIIGQLRGLYAQKETGDDNGS